MCDGEKKVPSIVIVVVLFVYGYVLCWYVLCWCHKRNMELLIIMSCMYVSRRFLSSSVVTCLFFLFFSDRMKKTKFDRATVTFCCKERSRSLSVYWIWF